MAVKSLSINEAIEYLGESSYAVSLESAFYRRLLHPVHDGADKLERIGRLFDPTPFQLPDLILSLADWLPKNSYRLLWIDHIEDVFPSLETNFLNILGNDLAPDHLIKNPGIQLGPLYDDLLDQLAGTEEQNSEAEAMIALCTLLSVGSWDAKLLTNSSTDYIEFWEGNILFHSESRDSLNRAIELCDFYGLKNNWT